MTIKNIVAIDLGASSGRVMLATYHKDINKLDLQEVHRFTNELKQVDNHFYWDLANTVNTDTKLRNHD